MLEMEALRSERTVFLSPIVHRRRETAQPVPIRAFKKLRPNMAVLFAPTNLARSTLSAHTKPIS